MVIIGIDIGLDGGFCIFDDGKMFAVYDIPTLNIGSGKKVRREYNVHEIVRILRKHQYDDEIIAIMENVHAFPGQGVSSMFKLGVGSGIWMGILASLGIPFEKVSPVTWKKAMLPGMGKEKDAARAKAIQLFPDVTHKLSKKKDHGKAEAMLLAEYMKRRLASGGQA